MTATLTETRKHRLNRDFIALELPPKILACQGLRQGVCQGVDPIMAAMTRTESLFNRLAADFEHRLSRPSTGADVSRWARTLPVLEGCSSASEVIALTGLCRERRRVLTCLIVHAAGDRLAAETAYAMLLGDLRGVAGQLTRTWRARPDEVDQAVAAAGWETIGRVAGRFLDWPDRVVVGGARTLVRDALRREARMAARVQPVAAVDPTSDTYPCFDTAADLIRDAVRRGVVSAGSARLVWATRVVGIPTADLADRSGDRANKLVMRRLRAERALSRDLPTRAAWGQAS